MAIDSELQKLACDFAHQAYMQLPASADEKRIEQANQKCREVCLGEPCSGAEQERPIICHIK